MDTYRIYLRTLQQGLKLDPEETRAVMAEVRGNLDDLAAHLRAQGYTADEAAAEAVRRFDDAHGLACDIRRARRGAPLLLQALALLLVSGGLTGVLLGGDALLTAIIALVRHTDTLMIDYGSAHTLANTIITGGAGWWLGNILVAVDLLGPGVGLLSAAAFSLWLGVIVLCGMTRVRWRRVSMGAGLVVLADLVLAFALLGTVPHAVPRPVAIPGRAALLAAGLRFQPAPGQPSGPIVVDRSSRIARRRTCNSMSPMRRATASRRRASSTIRVGAMTSRTARRVTRPTKADIHSPDGSFSN